MRQCPQERPFSPNSWTGSIRSNSDAVSLGTLATTRSVASLAGSNSLRWPLPRSPIARASPTWRSVCALDATSSITWDFDHRSPTALWPMPIEHVIGESTPISRNSSSAERACSMPRALGRRVGSDRLCPGFDDDRPLLSLFPGRGSAPPRPPSNSTLLDVRGPIPTMIAISEGKQADVSVLRRTGS
jgi:hypothetical protein